MKLFMLLILSLMIKYSLAGRPLITDDAGVVGTGMFQLETWIFADKRFAQHWIVPTFGIGERIEVTASGVHGLPFMDDRSYAISGPILQIKGRVTDNFALSGGGIAPWGKGIFKTEAWDHFFYGALTLDPGNFFIHLNLGQQSRRTSQQEDVALWGAAVEWRSGEKTHLFAEGANGDVYASIPGVAIQTGFRHDLTEILQIDGTLGRGVTGDPILPFWATLGLKWLYAL